MVIPSLKTMLKEREGFCLSIQNLGACIGERLRKERERLGLSRKEMAEKLDMYPGTYSGYENGSAPSIHNLVGIARILGLSMDYLCGLKEGDA